jgi:hypothetical protein
MREQLAMKKQKMIDELRELRKEYALTKDENEIDLEALDQKFKQTNNISNLSDNQRSSVEGNIALMSKLNSSMKKSKVKTPAQTKIKPMETTNSVGKSRIDMNSSAAETKVTDMAGANDTVNTKQHKSNSRSVDHFNTMKPTVKSTRNSNFQTTEPIKELAGTGAKIRNR